MYVRRRKATKDALGGKLIALNVFIENNRNLKSISWDLSKKLEKEEQMQEKYKEEINKIEHR